MKPLKKFPLEYFLKYKEKPVKLKKFSPVQTKIAKKYLQKLSIILKAFDIELKVRGSTAFGILGKGEVEVGVYPKQSDWKLVLSVLEEKWGKPENLEENYARFNDKCNGIEIEIIVLKGHDAKVDIKLHEYLLTHKELLNKYAEVKKKYAFSKREYQIQKNKFLDGVIKQIPV